MTLPPQAWAEYQRHRDEIGGIIDARCYSLPWLDAQLLSGDALAFGNDSAVIVIAVKQYPAGATELHGLVAAGELNSILDLIEQAEAWGTAAGITFACIASRPAWKRVLKQRGYAEHQTVLQKELSDGA